MTRTEIFLKFGHLFLEICERTDKLNTLIAILCALWGKVIIFYVIVSLYGILFSVLYSLVQHFPVLNFQATCVGLSIFYYE